MRERAGTGRAGKRVPREGIPRWPAAVAPLAVGAAVVAVLIGRAVNALAPTGRAPGG